MKWLESEQCSQEESIRRFCCMQNELKECWTASMHSECSEQGARLTKWLPLQLLTHLRTDHRCSTYVLYPHKCRENFFSLWQILAYLLLIPFISFALIMGIIIVMSKLSVFKWFGNVKIQWNVISICLQNMNLLMLQLFVSVWLVELKHINVNRRFDPCA